MEPGLGLAMDAQAGSGCPIHQVAAIVGHYRFAITGQQLLPVAIKPQFLD